MKKFVSAVFLVGIFTCNAQADITDKAPPSDAPTPTTSSNSEKGILFESTYGFSSVSPSGMNSALNDFQWPGGVIAKGPINDLQFLAVGLGYKIKNWAYVILRYEQSEQSMLPVLISPTTYSVTNEFLYYPLYLLVDAPLYRASGFFVNGVGGVGYSLKYELHQTENPGEDVTWSAHPMAYRLGINIGYSFADNFDLFADVFYESVTSKLKAANNYQTSFNGSPITKNQVFADENTGAQINVDMSGLRYGLGVKLRF